MIDPNNPRWMQRLFVAMWLWSVLDSIAREAIADLRRKQ